MKKFLSVIAAGVMALTMSQSADASVIVNVGGHDWEVSTIDGTAFDEAATLKSQVWYDESDSTGSAAKMFAEAVGNSLGITNPGIGEGGGPIFVHGLDPVLNKFSGWFCDTFVATVNTCAGGTIVSTIVADDSRAYTFAVATKMSAIPLPAGGLLLLTGLAAAGIGYRRKVAAKV